MIPCGIRWESARKRTSFATRCKSSRISGGSKRSKARRDELHGLPAPRARRFVPSRRVRLQRPGCRPATGLRIAPDDGTALLRGLQLLGLPGARYGAGFGAAVSSGEPIDVERLAKAIEEDRARKVREWIEQEFGPALRARAPKSNPEWVRLARKQP